MSNSTVAYLTWNPTNTPLVPAANPRYA
jgi:hypothetical protein